MRVREAGRGRDVFLIGAWSRMTPCLMYGLENVTEGGTGEDVMVVWLGWL